MTDTKRKPTRKRKTKPSATALKRCHETQRSDNAKQVTSAPAGLPLAVGPSLRTALENLAQQNWWGAHEETDTQASSRQLGLSLPFEVCSIRTRWTAGSFNVVVAHVPGGTAILKFAKV